MSVDDILTTSGTIATPPLEPNTVATPPPQESEVNQKLADMHNLLEFTDQDVKQVHVSRHQSTKIAHHTQIANIVFS